MATAALMFASLAAGCSSGGGNGNKSTGDTIKIGLNYELSGGVAAYGQSSRDGILMAFDEINAKGGVLGKKIEPVVMDNSSKADEATSVTTKLVNKEKVVAVLGPATSGAFKATIPAATKRKVPAISSSATADDVTVDKNGVKEYAFKTCFNDAFQGTSMANFASKTLNASKAVILTDNANDYSKGLAKSFKETFTANGGTIVAEEAFVADEKDFNAVLTKIKGMDFDVIYLPAYYEEVGLIIKQARDLGIDKPFLGGDGYDSPELIKIAGASALNNVFFSNHYSSQDTDAKVVEFVENFKAKYGKEPDAFHALGYDLGYFIADAIERAGEADSVKIKEALEQTKDFPAITGVLSIDENHNPVKSITIIELKDGVQSVKEKIEP
ncbi:ethanolamine utilization protein EutJ [Clostridium thermosuccinogenes]|uniref:Ethanolamine utilization protein EutJ n=2 Tax=Clostridium thermosuccinogenes TaxID=84032 RepID=A0A2K2FFF6_9CLOT|nr:ethanolamine utilization protein EutJ [Pseudoclostridium thermosuccinogenes]PNT94478.1 ethanolamine utilization protein EutJ [Pseudoclostridium thermosuccinogenes]PNT97498.1 ethanolamine utilization protein EutJ [Pseudoclostridium thermosuccinogenes]PNT99529.1 ethanolamine utilization protein EutJ [Pseudoclostridium thermosuccinogenes]